MNSLSDEENRENAKMKFAMIGEQIREWLREMWSYDGINDLFDDLLRNPDGSSVNRIIGAVKFATQDSFRYHSVDDKKIQDTFFKVEIVIKDDEGNEEKKEVKTLDRRDFDFLSRSIVLAKILQSTYPSMDPDELRSLVIQEEIIKDGRFVIGDGKLAESELDGTSPQPNDLNVSLPAPNDLTETLPQPNDLNVSSPQPNDLNGALPTDDLIMQIIPKKKDEDENYLSLPPIRNMKISKESPPSSNESKMIPVSLPPISVNHKAVDPPNFSHSFKPFDYPPQEPNPFQKVCEEFGKTMDFISEEWRNYLAEIDITKLDEAFLKEEPKDQIGIHLPLSHNLLNSTKEEEHGGYLPVLLHLDTFFKMWTLFFLQKQNTCVGRGKKDCEYSFPIEKFSCSQVVIRPEDEDIQCMLQPKRGKKKIEEGDKEVGGTTEKKNPPSGSLPDPNKNALSLSNISFDSKKDEILDGIKEISYRLDAETIDMSSQVCLSNHWRTKDPMFDLRGRLFYFGRNDETNTFFSTLQYPDFQLGFSGFQVNPCPIEHIPVFIKEESKYYYLKSHNNEQVRFSIRDDEKKISFPINESGGDERKVEENDAKEIISLIHSILFGHTELLEQVL